VAKHDCGSCRFFDQASDGKHGWCTHPDRRESTSVRILVRAAELRCRNDWGQDQWQAKAASDQVLDVVMTDHPVPAPARVDRPLPSIERPSYDSPPAAAILSSAPLLPTDANSENDEPARTVSDDLNRELLRGAHARYRERQKNKGYSAVPDRKPESEPLIISNKYIPPSGQTGQRATRGVTNSVFEFSASQSVRGFDEIPDVPVAVEPATPHLAEPAVQLQSQPSSPSNAPAFPRPAPDWTTEELFKEKPNDELYVQTSVTTQRTNQDVDLSRTEAPRPRELSRPAHAPSRAAELETWDVSEDEQPNDNHGLWSDIPRCCQTCRDFRPAGNGQRGWCNNQWAFRHRRMVDAHDIPCETSVGNWWIPVDGAWQGDFDISLLGQPTPLMDKWFGRRGGDEESADDTSERRRRRTGSW
jgi:hypothetical protein